MTRRRGFLAELQHQSQLAARQRAQAEQARVQEHAAEVREAERALREAERDAAAWGTAEDKAAEKEAKRLYEEARLAECEALNTQLAETADELNSILSATLTVDDYVDLEQLRARASHPPLPQAYRELPTPAVVPVSAPPEPVFTEPAAPTGLGSVFGGKRRHAAAVALARGAFEAEHQVWQKEAAAIPGRQLQQIQERDAKEKQRLRALQAARAWYQSECDKRDAEMARFNEPLDALIAGLAAGEHAAVQQYVGIVLVKSVYPAILSVEHDYEFDPKTRELTLTALICPPDALPSEKTYRYVKAKDEIAATDLSKKDLKERYASIVNQVALRSLHEIFEADREGQIRTIALQVATDTSDPATGRPRRIPFVAVAAERDAFMAFALDNVVPDATLEHLGAAVSKSPYELVAIDETPGVRGR